MGVTVSYDMCGGECAISEDFLRRNRSRLCPLENFFAARDESVGRESRAQCVECLMNRCGDGHRLEGDLKPALVVAHVACVPKAVGLPPAVKETRALLSERNCGIKNTRAELHEWRHGHVM